ncbi:MAG: V-type ATP synthase subunit D [Marinoscillum sp.]
MAFKFQYNKTTIQELNKQLTIRKKALPILKNKETALRLEVKKRQVQVTKADNQRHELLARIRHYVGFWNEFPNILFIDDLDTCTETIVGVKVPEVRAIEFKLADISWWNYPAWIPAGIELLKEAIVLDIRVDVLKQQIAALDNARKKTTQKVNLYEKVQIPEMDQAVLKIKRFLEDKENIAKAGQKIMKSRQA